MDLTTDDPLLPALIWLWLAAALVLWAGIFTALFWFDGAFLATPPGLGG